MRAYDWALSSRWVMTQEAYENLMDIAARTHDRDLEVLEAKMGKKLENSRIVTNRDGVATIPVVGPIFRRANMFTEISGATSNEALAKDFHNALNDSSVRSILLNVDSPGGEVNGTHELAQMIRDARGRKPIVAYSGGSCCSGAYWIASAADEIVANQTSFLGSIGVAWPISRKVDPDKLTLTSKGAPNKRPDVNTEAGRAQLQSEIDDIEEVFVGEVASNRGVPVNRVLQKFGGGASLVGRKAVRAGMADRISTYEATHAKLVKAGNRQSIGYSGKAATASGGDDPMGLKLEKFYNLFKKRQVAEANGEDLDFQSMSDAEILSLVGDDSPAVAGKPIESMTKDELRSVVNGKPSAVHTPTPEPTASEEDDMAEKTAADQINELTAKLARQEAGTRKSVAMSARTWAETEVRERRADAFESPFLAAMYENIALAADHGFAAPATISVTAADGKVHEFDSVTALVCHAQAARKPHSRTEEAGAVREVANPPHEAPTPPTAESKGRALAAANKLGPNE